jgi:hypothetical protein
MNNLESGTLSNGMVRSYKNHYTNAGVGGKAGFCLVLFIILSISLSFISCNTAGTDDGSIKAPGSGQDPTSITISPAGVTLSAGYWQPFVATVYPAGSTQEVEWSIVGTSDTTTVFTENRLYVGLAETPKTATVRAVLTTKPEVFAEVDIQITDPVYVDHTDALNAIENARDKLAALPYTIAVGDVTKNPGEALIVQNYIQELMTLLQGIQQERDVVTDAGTVKEEITVYDEAGINYVTELLVEATNGYNGTYLVVSQMSFTYTGAPEQVTLAHNGYYEVDLVGGSGGATWTVTNKTALGGKGGHVFGKYQFPADTQLSVRVGGAGVGSAEYVSGSYTDTRGAATAAGRGSTRAGGWNGGGTGGGSAGLNNAYNNSPGAGGGGATDIRLAGDLRALSGVSSTDPRIAVAGGGGGSAQSADEYPKVTGIRNAGVPGGNAGGLTGASNNARNSQFIVLGGTQNSGNTTQLGFGESGIPGEAIAFNFEGKAGGGAGWWGGHAIRVSGTATIDAGCTGSGAGGSSYTGTGLNPVNETASGYGNGSAIIRWHGETN